MMNAPARTQPDAPLNGATSHHTQPGLLSPGQMARTAAVGVIYWFMAALFVRYTPEAGVFGRATGVATFVLSVPVAWLGVVILRWAAALQPERIVAGVAFGTGAATFCDGIALTWGRTLYGTDSGHVLLGSAWILWGVGLFLTLAYVEAFRTQRES
jgi:hypothetical protein